MYRLALVILRDSERSCRLGCLEGVGHIGKTRIHKRCHDSAGRSILVHKIMMNKDLRRRSQGIFSCRAVVRCGSLVLTTCLCLWIGATKAFCYAPLAWIGLGAPFSGSCAFCASTRSCRTSTAALCYGGMSSFMAVEDVAGERSVAVILGLLSQKAIFTFA